MTDSQKLRLLSLGLTRYQVGWLDAAWEMYMELPAERREEAADQLIREMEAAE